MCIYANQHRVYASPASPYTTTYLLLNWFSKMLAVCGCWIRFWPIFDLSNYFAVDDCEKRDCCGGDNAIRHRHF